MMTEYAVNLKEQINEKKAQRRRASLRETEAAYLIRDLIETQKRLDTEIAAMESELSAMLHKIPITPKDFVCHRCDNRSCVRPTHLYVGNNKTNMLDMYRRKRSSRKGEHNSFAKLTPEIVLKIKSYKGKLSTPKIGELFGISKAHAWQLINDKAWPHLSIRALPLEEKK